MSDTSLTTTTHDASVTYSYHYRSRHRYHILLWCMGCPVVISPLIYVVAPLLMNEALAVLAATVPLAVGGLIGMMMQWKSRVSTLGLVLNRVGGSMLLCIMVWGYCIFGGFALITGWGEGIYQVMIVYVGCSMMYTFFMIPCVIVWLVVVTNNIYEPGEATRAAAGDINRFKMLSRDISLTYKQRAELIGELARYDADELLFVLGSDVFNPSAIKLVATRLLEEVDPGTAQAILDRAIPVTQERSLNTFMEVWQSHPERMKLFLTLARQSVIQTHGKWAYVMVQAAHEANVSGAQMAAITTLSTARIDQHALSLSYIEEFGYPAHIPHLKEARRAFSINIPLGKKIEQVIAHIETRHGGIRGGLSLAADDSTRGGLSQADPTGHEG